MAASGPGVDREKLACFHPMQRRRGQRAGLAPGTRGRPALPKRVRFASPPCSGAVHAAAPHCTVRACEEELCFYKVCKEKKTRWRCSFQHSPPCRGAVHAAGGAGDQPQGAAPRVRRHPGAAQRILHSQVGWWREAGGGAACRSCTRGCVQKLHSFIQSAMLPQHCCAAQAVSCPSAGRPRRL